MRTGLSNWFKVIQAVLFFVTIQAAFSCAVLPGENEMLVGRFLLELTTSNSDKDSGSKHSASFVQPVENEKDVSHQNTLTDSTSKQIRLTSHDPSSSLSVGFVHAFIASLSVIIVSELGDKTFFIAAIMAMRHSRLVVFAGAMLALGLMTVLSATLGFATTVIPKKYTLYISTALFIFFGLRMLKEGLEMDPNEGQEEYEEVQAELKKKEEERESEQRLTQDIETGIIRGGKKAHPMFGFLSPIFLQALTLTFLAEWGDRSQLATILLAARENVIGVTLGGTLGHALCTGLAVIGGRIIAQKISVRTVTIVGGIVFLVFAVLPFFLKD